MNGPWYVDAVRRHCRPARNTALASQLVYRRLGWWGVWLAVAAFAAILQPPRAARSATPAHWPLSDRAVPRSVVRQQVSSPFLDLLLEMAVRQRRPCGNDRARPLRRDGKSNSTSLMRDVRPHLGRLLLLPPVLLCIAAGVAALPINQNILRRDGLDGGTTQLPSCRVQVCAGVSLETETVDYLYNRLIVSRVCQAGVARLHGQRLLRRCNFISRRLSGQRRRRRADGHTHDDVTGQRCARVRCYAAAPDHSGVHSCLLRSQRQRRYCSTCLAGVAAVSTADSVDSVDSRLDDQSGPCVVVAPSTFPSLIGQSTPVPSRPCAAPTLHHYRWR